ncbi:MAG: hypothetical protein RJB01_340 [Actinomycetota bacterium]
MDSEGADPIASMDWEALAVQIPIAEDTLDTRADIAAVAMIERARIRLNDRLAAARGAEIVIGLKRQPPVEVPRVKGRVHSLHSAGVLLEPDEGEYELCMVFWPAIAWIRNVPWALRDERDQTHATKPRMVSSWSHQVRAAENQPVRVHVLDGLRVHGRAQLGEDFISVHDEQGVEWTVPFGSVAQIDFHRAAK